MAKLTPTFNDQAKGGNGIKIVSAHEPVQVVSDWKPVSAPMTVEKEAEKPTEKRPLKVALVGTAPSSRMLAPFNDPSWTIWGCSPGNQNTLPRVDAWFELHKNLHWPENAHYGLPYIEWLKRLTIPVYMQDQGYVPNAVIYPKDEMVNKFGKDYFTSSFSWMMALAIHMGASEIALFGIDMASRDEYIIQRPGFYFFRYVAQQQGIKVWAPNESDIMQSPGLYAYSDAKPFGRKTLARKKELQDRIDGIKNELQKLQHNLTYLEGAMEDVSYFESIWLGLDG